MRIVFLARGYDIPKDTRLTEESHVRFHPAHVEHYHVMGQHKEESRHLGDQWQVEMYMAMPDCVRVMPTDIEEEVTQVEAEMALLRKRRLELVKKAIVVGDLLRHDEDGKPVVG